MKKIFLFIICFSLIWFVSVNANDDCNNSCKIADAPAPALTEYFTNIETLIGNIVSEISSAERSSETSDTRQQRNRIVWALWWLFSFRNNFSSFDFTIALPITNEVPPEVKRDHERLEGITENLRNILTRAERRSAWSVVPNNICNGISYCTLSDSATISKILTDLIDNNSKISELYRTSILDKAFQTNWDTYMLVSSDFRKQIEEYYNKDTLTECSMCEENFGWRIRESIQNIGSLNADGKQWIQNWKDAWALMRGWSRNPTLVETEELLLAQYLESQGISWDQAAVVMDNLARYNSWWLSTSNPLFNSTNYSTNNIKNEVKTFSETLKEKFAEDDDGTVPIAELARVNVQLRSSEDIKKSITTLYEEQKPAALVEDTLSTEIQLRIIKMHISLINSINMLEGDIETAEKVCNKAGPRGQCEY